MATKKQIAANRRNARRSTGPKTPEGKAVSSLNGLRHGLHANTSILPNESAEDYERTLASLEAHFKPQDVVEQSLVEQMANAKWKMARAEAYESKCFNPDDDQANVTLFIKLTAVNTRLQRAYMRAGEELKRMKAARPPRPDQPAQPAEPQKSSDDPAINLWWVNPETGERTLAAQSPAARAIHDLSDILMKPQPPLPA